MPRAWAIKLGSAGSCVPFCEEHGIVGIGWQAVSPDILRASDRSVLAEHLVCVCGYSMPRQIGSALGQLTRFARECQIGDFILYYVPQLRHVVICRVIGPAIYRDFGLEDKVDIWHYRKVERVGSPIAILDLYAPVKASLLGPRMSFWEIHNYDAVMQLANGRSPSLMAAPDPEILDAYQRLRALTLKRLESLNEIDWEWLTVDYFKQLGGQIDERKVGGNGAVMDFEVSFEHGMFSELWRVQVKRYQDQKVEWSTINDYLDAIGGARPCFVAAYGFSDEAWEEAEDHDVRLLEASDFILFVLSGNVRDELRRKLRIPSLDILSDADVSLPISM